MFQYWTGKKRFASDSPFVTQEVCDQDQTYYYGMPRAFIPCALETISNVI